MPSLTLKQRIFVNAYLGSANGNATEAARRAGYSEPRVAGCRTLANVAIQEAIARSLDESALCANEVLSRLADMATVDIADFARIKPDGSYKLDLAKAKRQGKTHLIKKLKPTQYGISIEFHDPQAALDKLGKYHRLWDAGAQNGDPDLAGKTKKFLDGATEPAGEGAAAGQ